MQARYALRFDSGERKGERVPISGAGVTVGRKPGNSVQILDNSVSGRHAEFAVESQGIVLRDLGSTNGTKVGGERVSERRLIHGDVVLLGSVRLTFLDGDLPAPAPGGSELELELEGEGGTPAADRDSGLTGDRPSGPTGAGAATGDAVRTISADKVAKSSRLSMASTLVLLAALAIGAGGWWLLRARESASSAGAPRPLENTPGNLLAGAFSFEALELDGEDSAWSNDPAAPAVFAVDGSSRRSGDDGVGVVLSSGQSALLRSRASALSGARRLDLRAWARVEGAARARIGLEFESSVDASARTLVWSPASASDAFELLEWNCAVPGGFDSVRVVLGARAAGDGAADFDDVVLLAGGDPPAPLAHESFQLFALGAPASAAVLFKIDRTLLSDLHVRGADSERVDLTPTAADGAFAIAYGAGAALLSVRADGPLTSTAPVSLGAGGYRSHGASFEREGLDRLLLGAGKDLVALVFDPPVRVQARAEGAGLRMEFALGATTRASVRVAFRAERESALALARQARDAERAGRLGECLAAWTRLRDEAPFDTELMAEGEASRARLAELGASEVRSLRVEIERARFFRLVELYRQCRTRAQDLGRRFAGSELEALSAELVQQVRSDLDQLEADLDRAERARLESIARALGATRSEHLARRVQSYLDQRFGARGDAANGGGR